jgi:hypothetical protein
LFKNFGVHVQSFTRVRSLLFNPRAAITAGTKEMVMKSILPLGTPLMRRAVLTLAIVSAAGALSACSHAMMLLHRTGATRPPASEFGLGPRPSADGRYLATLAPASPLRPRKLQTVLVTVRDAEGHPVDDAQISVDGGMPQHGHGLPTRPRVTRQLGDGVYEIQGVRFNMGGWWEFKLAIAGAQGADTVTFNLDL